jgi:hypothetical protein
MVEKYAREVHNAARIAEAVFQAERWTWSFGPFGNPEYHRVPTYAQLCETLDSLVSDIANDPEARFVSSGRFMVQRTGIGIEICLELESVDDPHSDEHAMDIFFAGVVDVESRTQGTAEDNTNVAQAT